MKKILLTVTFCLISSTLTGCASIVNGTSESVSVQTSPEEGAKCSLTNNKGQWFVSDTPGSVTVHRSYQPLTVDCQKDGYANAETKVESKTKGMLFGNVVFGGVIGAGVDAGDGAAYDYPVNIMVPMEKQQLAAAPTVAPTATPTSTPTHTG